ncbi:MAG: aldo/keto reductase [Solobacterium sp.]|nr:aldo/keto reductase [Solobacterium sp.]MBQ9823173.1 aldo/keto reductase [Solobacterium sp.]
MKQFFGTEMPKLGFGMMRLPRFEDKTFDVEQVKTMVDRFLAAGLKYFDTAFVYQGSEEVVRQALVERYPRDSYFLTTKLNAGTWAAANEEEAKKQLETSLKRTGAGYFDFYLLHALSKENIGNYDKYGIWDFVKEAKEKGLIKHYGFSFHDSPEVLDQLLNDHPDVELVQLQINYADWNDLDVQSRGCYEVCVKHNKPVVVMEPVKGGTLAVPPQQVQDLFKSENPDASFASWAIRFAASLDQVMVVLSGMSAIGQMEDNISYMSDFRPLDEKEQAVIAKAQDILASIPQIKCTACHYCTNGCPMSIDIPSIFKAMNRNLIFGQLDDAKRRYANATKEGGKASDCIHCLQCEDACPQHIEITSWLERAAAELEG